MSTSEPAPDRASAAEDFLARLPPDLQSAATDALSRIASEREPAWSALLAAHPAHASDLVRLSEDLAATERLLDGGFRIENTAPTTIGPYRVLHRLGQGAFGEVFACRQDHPVERQVAVKVLRPGVGDRTTLERFTREQQIIASLQHPNIAQVFDAGTLPDGRPYFVMDLIVGAPLNRLCDERALPIEARLDVFLDLCSGVQHAHGHGVIHRDLKPQNVLVVELDGRLVPKIIDFGIAKVLDAPPFGPFATETGRVVGTPGYMSPEQARGASADVDARSDVFGLGVLLYELLCGHPPWAVFGESTDPLRPSTRLATDPFTATGIAERRATELRRLGGALRGDLDWIALRCLRSIPEERYQSVQELVADLDRHRRSEPVRAGPPSVMYRLRKFGRRHRTVVVAAAATLAMALIGTAVAMRIRDQASDSEARHFENSLTTATQLLRRANDPRLEDAPHRDELRQALILDVLQLHDGVLSERTSDDRQRILRLDTLLSLIEVHYLLGQWPEGQRVAEEAVEAASALVAAGADGLDQRSRFARAQRHLGRFLLFRQQQATAAPAYRAAIDEFERLNTEEPGAHCKLLAKALVEYASVAGKLGDPTQQFAAQTRAIELLEQRSESEPDDSEAQRDLVRFHCGLANLHRRRNDMAAAFTSMARAQHLLATRPGITDEEGAVVANRLGSLHDSSGEVPDAIAAYEDAVAWNDRLLQQNPGRQPLRIQLLNLHKRLCTLHGILKSGERVFAHAQAAVDTVDRLSPEFEGRLERRFDTLVHAGAEVLSLGNRLETESAARWLRTAIDLAGDRESAAAISEQSQLRARILSHAAETSLGRQVAPSSWEHDLERADALALPAYAYECLLGLANVSRGSDSGRAREFLEKARKLAGSGESAVADIEPHRLGRLRWQVEFDSGDFEATAAAAEDLLAGDPDWLSLHHGADGLRAARTLAEGSHDLERAAVYASRSTAAYEQLVELSDSMHTTSLLLGLCAGQARLRLAGQIDPGDPRSSDLRLRGLATLDALRDRAPPSWWDEELWVDAIIADHREDLSRGDVPHAMSQLERIRDSSPTGDHALRLAELWMRCGECAAHDPLPEAEVIDRWRELAIASVLRAVALGVGMDRIRALPGIALIGDNPRLRAILSSRQR